MKKSIIAVLAVSLWSFGATAQEEGFTKRIDITRDYSVDVQRAEKIDVALRELDTVIVRPKLQYAIVPTAWESRFTARSIEPVEIGTARWNVQTPFYLRAGFGLPLQSVVDLYWTPLRERRETLGVYLNHEGSNIRYDNVGQRLSSLAIRNKVGVYGEKSFRNETELSAGIDYTGGIFSPLRGETSARSVDIFDNDIHASAALCGGFSRRSPLKYELHLGGGAFLYNDKKMSRRSDASETDYHVSFGLSGFGGKTAWLPESVEVIHNGHFGQGALLGNYTDLSVSVEPRWSLRLGRYLKIDFGGGYIYDAGHNYIADFDLSYDRLEWMKLYVKASRKALTFDPRTIAEINPYASVGSSNPYGTVMHNNAETGFSGKTGIFEYSLCGGVESGRHLFFLNYGGALSRPDMENLTLWYAGAQVKLHIARRLLFEAAGRYNLPRSASGGADIYQYEADANLVWTPAAKFTMSLGADFKGKRSIGYIDGVNPDPVFLPLYDPTVNINLHAEYALKKSLSVYLHGDNLLNQDIFTYYIYGSMGINVSGGIKVVF